MNCYSCENMMKRIQILETEFNKLKKRIDDIDDDLFADESDIENLIKKTNDMMTDKDRTCVMKLTDKYRDAIEHLENRIQKLENN